MVGEGRPSRTFFRAHQQGVGVGPDLLALLAGGDEEISAGGCWLLSPSCAELIRASSATAVRFELALGRRIWRWRRTMPATAGGLLRARAAGGVAFLIRLLLAVLDVIVNGAAGEAHAGADQGSQPRIAGDGADDRTAGRSGCGAAEQPVLRGRQVCAAGKRQRAGQENEQP